MFKVLSGIAMILWPFGKIFKQALQTLLSGMNAN